MSGTIRFYCTGYSARFGNWHSEVIESTTKAVAKEQFSGRYPTLRKVTVYTLGSSHIPKPTPQLSLFNRKGA